MVPLVLGGSCARQRKHLAQKFRRQQSSILQLVAVIALSVRSMIHVSIGNPSIVARNVINSP